MINVFQPSLGAEELQAVRKVFESNWIGKGRVTDEFEMEFARFIGVHRLLIRSVSCCTEGLFQSMGLLGIGSGDEVVLPSISFVGAANAVLSSGAQPVFCDVDKRTLNATAQTMEEKITPRTKAIMLLHYGGVPCEMNEICDLVGRKRLALIEDSACSVVSRYKGRACGTFGDVGTWSFDAMKILVCGDGGMVYCRSPELAQRVEEMLYLGLAAKSGMSSKAETKWWEFEISCAGRRAIMNDVSSAIGIEQLKKLPRFVTRRKEIQIMYDLAFSALDWIKLPPKLPLDCESSYYFYWIQMPPEIRDNLAKYLKDRGIYTTFRYYPLHWVSHYGTKCRLPNSEEAAQTTLCIPIHQALSDADVGKIIDCISAFGETL